MANHGGMDTSLKHVSHGVRSAEAADQDERIALHTTSSGKLDRYKG